MFACSESNELKTHSLYVNELAIKTRAVPCRARMQEENIGSLPVVEDGNPVGIETERDFFKLII